MWPWQIMSKARRMASWCVMEAGFAGDLRVVKKIGIEPDLRFSRTAAKEVHHSTAPNHLHSALPHFGLSNGFNRDVPRRGRLSLRELHRSQFL